MAQAELWLVREHCDNLLRCALDQDYTAPPAWAYEKLQQRYGLPALLQLSVDPAELVVQSLYRVTRMQRRYPPPQH
jgi:hypothetical protein